MSSRGRATPRTAVPPRTSSANTVTGPRAGVGDRVLDHRGASMRRPSGPDVCPVERKHLRGARRVDEEDAGSVRDVVAEELGRLVPVRRAPRGVEERDVVRVRELLRGCSRELAETDREHGGAQRVLERLPRAEVGRGGASADHLRGPDRLLRRGRRRGDCSWKPPPPRLDRTPRRGHAGRQRRTSRSSWVTWCGRAPRCPGAEEAHRAGDLGGEDLDRAVDSCASAGHQAVEVRAADQGESGAERDRGDDVGAVHDAGVEVDSGPCRPRAPRREQMERNGCTVELPAAVVRERDPVDAGAATCLASSSVWMPLTTSLPGQCSDPRQVVVVDGRVEHGVQESATVPGQRRTREDERLSGEEVDPPRRPRDARRGRCEVSTGGIVIRCGGRAVGPGDGDVDGHEQRVEPRPLRARREPSRGRGPSTCRAGTSCVRQGWPPRRPRSTSSRASRARTGFLPRLRRSRRPFRLRSSSAA